MRRLGFETRYTKDQGEIGTNVREEPADEESNSVLDMVTAITREVPEREWERVPDDLSKNVDYYLYGSKKTDK